MGIETDIVARMDALANYRVQWETQWDEVAKYCLPDVARFMPGSSQLNPSSYDAFAQGPVSVERGRARFDDTALRAVDRLAAGMESLVTPQNEKWHGLEVTDPLAPEESDEEKEYFETYRDYMFKVRYDARSGFINAHQKALRSAIALGTGVVFIEENMGSSAFAVPALYRYLPMSQVYLAVNAQGEPDTLYRKFSLSARQAIQKFGKDSVADGILRSAEQASDKDRQFEFIHAIQPREEGGSYGAINRKAAFGSYYLDRTHMKMVGESGFYEFPAAVYYWQPVEENIPYAQSPVMFAMSDIRGLNAVRKTALRGLQQFIDPPMAIAHDGVMNRPNLNPRAINYSAIDGQGRMKIQPIMTMQRPDFVQEIVEGERKNVNESLYITLFQILSQNPDMTATEAMIRANEKGELLGPAGGKLQSAMSRMIERESGILERKGAFRPNGALSPPDSLRGRGFGARFTSPLDRLRRAKEGLGIQQTLQVVIPLAQIDPSIIDNYDLDYVARALPEINGGVQKMLKRVEERDADRQQKQQMAAMQQGLNAAQQAAATAKDAVPAVGQAAAILGNGMAGAPPAQ